MGQSPKPPSSELLVPLDELTVPLDQLQAAPPTDGPSDAVAGALSTMNPIPAVQAIGKALIPEVAARAAGASDPETYGPVNTATHVLDAMNQVKAEADQAWSAGDYQTAVRKYADWLASPVLGITLGLDEMADKAANGQPFRAAGEATGLGLSLFGPQAIANARIKAPTVKTPTIPASANPQTADAVAFGRANNIPLDAGTVTDSPLVKNAQKRLSSTIGAAGPIDKFQAAKDAGLTRTGRALSDRITPTPETPESAGAALRAGAEGKVRTLDATADAAYGRLRRIEQANPTAMLADVAQAKKDLRPLYDELTRQASLGIPMQGGRGRVLAALDGLMRGPDQISASTLDAALSDLKDMARPDSMPELRTKGQGAAAAAIPKLEAQLQAAVARGGPDAVRALRDGRAAFREKMQVADVLDKIKEEPVGAYRSATARQDAQIQHLRDLQRVAPNAIPKVGRAWLDDAMATATEAGKFDHADRLYANWQNLGDATKQMLFGTALTKDLDNFFLLAKKLNENPNPSGTANVLGINATQVLAYLPAKAMAKILYSPGGIKLLTQGLRLSVHPGTQAAVASLVKQAAKVAGVTNTVDAGLVAGRSGLSAQDEGQTVPVGELQGR